MVLVAAHAQPGGEHEVECPPAGVELVDVNRLNLGWLVKLRWASIGGQAATILGVEYAMGVPLPLAPLTAIVGVEVGTNLACASPHRRRPAVRERHLALLIALDLMLFTGLLYLTGGPTNPFSSLYLVHLSLAALAVGPRFTWALVALTLACSAALFQGHVPLEMGGHDHAAMGHYGMHLKGMWVALGVAAVFIVYFLNHLKRALANREVGSCGVRASAPRDKSAWPGWQRWPQARPTSSPRPSRPSPSSPKSSSAAWRLLPPQTTRA